LRSQAFPTEVEFIVDRPIKTLPFDSIRYGLRPAFYLILKYEYPKRGGIDKKLTLAPSSTRIERDNLKHLLPRFGRLLVTDIEAFDISKYQLARLAAGASPKTVNLEVGTLRAILRRHRTWANIQLDVPMLATCDDIGHALTDAEEERILQECRASRSRALYPAVVLALSTAMRYSEIRLLTWGQIDLAAATVSVGKSKTINGAGRGKPLNGRAHTSLQLLSSKFPAVCQSTMFFQRKNMALQEMNLQHVFTRPTPRGQSVTGKRPGKPLNDEQR
jgi:integrase